jgi:diacylglycerol kinase
MINSFKNAFKGILFCIRNERNMRIHIAVTLIVLTVSVCFYEHTRTQRILLVLTCALVMSLEIVNTAIESLTDKLSPELSPLAKAAKDCAAGAVLVAAIAAVVIGVMLFL